MYKLAFYTVGSAKYLVDEIQLKKKKKKNKQLSL